MHVDVLLFVADQALRTVMALALRQDGCVVETAATPQAALDALATARPRVLILDGTMSNPSDPVRWAGRYGPDIPLILLTSAWEEPPPVTWVGVVPLPMPFTREDLRRAIAAAMETRVQD